MIAGLQQPERTEGATSPDAREAGSVLELVLRVADAHPDARAITSVDDGAGTSYRELVAGAEALRGQLRALGVGRGSFVGLSLPTSGRVVECLLALMSLEAVCVPLSGGLTPHELAPILENAGMQLLVADAGTLAGWQPALAKGAAGLTDIVAVGGLPPEIEGVRLHRLEEVAGARSPLELPAPGAAATLHYTYKGLGYPLGVLHCHQAYASCVLASTEAFPIGPGEGMLAALPVYPVFGLAGGLLPPLARGAEVHLVPSLRGCSLAALFGRPRLRYAVLVPALLLRLCEEVDRVGAPVGIDQVTIVCGGSELDDDLAARASALLGREPLQGYGLTEALPVLANHAARWRRGSLGVPLVGEARVVGPSGDEVAPGRAGELLIGGPTRMLGYHGRPHETARFLEGGLVRTGDLVVREADGFLRFIGRRLPITKILSQMVDLKEVEEVLRGHEGVHEARVTVGRVGAREELVASIVARRGARVSPAELVAHCRERLMRHKVPRRIRIFRTGLVRVNRG